MPRNALTRKNKPKMIWQSEQKTMILGSLYFKFINTRIAEHTTPITTKTGTGINSGLARFNSIGVKIKAENTWYVKVNGFLPVLL
jgi:hypothetical protein